MDSVVDPQLPDEIFELGKALGRGAFAWVHVVSTRRADVPEKFIFLMEMAGIYKFRIFIIQNAEIWNLKFYRSY
jgi:hypothetical protein